MDDDRAEESAGVVNASGAGGVDGDEDLPMSLEEQEYEKQDAAARPLQAAVRRWQGRRYAKEYGKQCFIKEWDAEKKQFWYVDTRRSPPAKQWSKPRWLGDDDLPEATRYRAPAHYPPRKQTQRQFALVSHTAEFDDDKVHSLPSPLGVRLEHEELKERMQNPYTANFAAKDTTFLWEPTKAIFLKSLESLRIKCQAHVDAEAKALKGRLERNLLETFDKLYNELTSPPPQERSSQAAVKAAVYAPPPPLPSWEDASNFTSPLLDEPSWRAFDQFRLAMAHARASAQLAAAANAARLKAEASAQAAAQGRPPPASGKGSGSPAGVNSAKLAAKLAAKRAAKPAAKAGGGGGGDPDAPSSLDLHDAMQSRKTLFDAWRAGAVARRAEAAQEAEEARRAKKLSKLRAAAPGRVVEEWELDAAPGDDAADEGNGHDEVGPPY